MKSYERILRAVYAQPWAIQPEKLEEILGFLELKAAGIGPAPETRAEIEAAAQVAQVRAKNSAAMGGGAIAVLPLYGIISHRANMTESISGPGGTSTAIFGEQFRQAMSDPNVKAIVLDVDSPGGSIDGVPELAEEILGARGVKPVTAVANTLMASAAYWIAASASEIVASPSAMVGSIGVYSAHTDVSKAAEQEGVKVTLISAGKYKTEGNPYEPLGDDARASMQAMVNEYYGMFVRAVAKGRNAKTEDVCGGYGEGRVVSAASAVRAGLVDRVGTLADVLAKHGGGARSQREALRAEDVTLLAAREFSRTEMEAFRMALEMAGA